MIDDTDSLNPSILGKKDYWDQFYVKELENFAENSDEGEIWFGKGCETRIVKFLANCGSVQRDKSHILDVGCGNGSFLRNLAERNYLNLVGIDYSSTAIELAKKIASDSGLNHINFEVCDLLVSNGNELKEKFDLIHDKGTYDAISLMENSQESRRKYADFLRHHCSSGGLFVLTSCNWTKEELLTQFADLELVEEIPAPTITFGGKQGKTVTTLVFRQKPSD